MLFLFLLQLLELIAKSQLPSLSGVAQKNYMNILERVVQKGEPSATPLLHVYVYPDQLQLKPVSKNKCAALPQRSRWPFVIGQVWRCGTITIKLGGHHGAFKGHTMMVLD